jgi:hypothetical protein
MRSHIKKPSRLTRNRSHERRALVIERSGRRQVYPVGDPLAYRQPLPELIPLRFVLADVLSVLLHQNEHNLALGGQI